ncbi:hypothetical protein B0H21DRAFT_310729 [Amylocystis lapponica]|nr:hypothetical protein B0H21DRAFT_310729 [Amylocystis lapponica]
MHPSSHRRSPKVTPRPLKPPPRTPPTRPIRSFSPDPQPATISTPKFFSTVLRRPFHDPYEVLCHEFNVIEAVAHLRADGSVPETIDMQVLRDAHMPTHALVILESRSSASGSITPSLPLAVPVNSELLASNFSNDVGRLSTELSVPGSTLPVPFWNDQMQALVVSLPAIPLVAPHPPSIPLLLLFGLGIHLTTTSASGLNSPSTSSGRSRSVSPGPFVRRVPAEGTSTAMLATYLLPTEVIEEFPAAPAMAEVFAELCDDEELARFAAYTQGLWRNVLALGPRDAALVDVVRTAWNVTAEARRIRERRRQAAGADGAARTT